MVRALECQSVSAAERVEVMSDTEIKQKVIEKLTRRQLFIICLFLILCGCVVGVAAAIYAPGALAAIWGAL